MHVADRHLVDDLPANQLDAIILAENAGVDHLLVVVDTEAMADQSLGHANSAHVVDQLKPFKA